MTSAPTLSRGDIERFLGDYYRSVRSDRSLVAVYGSGARDTLQGESFGTFEVIPVRSELELRETMPAFDVEQRIIFLVPWSGEIPLDLAGRFSKNGRILSIGPKLRLRQMFGASDAELRVEKSALAKHLLAQSNDSEKRFDIGGGRLTIDAMWRAWLSQVAGLDRAAELGLDSLMAWAAWRSGGPEAAAELSGDTGTLASLELMDYLAETIDPQAPAVWLAWEEGHGRALLELAIVFEALAQVDDGEARMWTKMVVKKIAGALDEDERLELAAALGARAKDAVSAFRRLLPDDGAPMIRALYGDADSRGAEVREHLSASLRLPSAWSARVERLGALLQSAATNPTVEALSQANALRRELEAHESFVDLGSIVDRAEMTTRLLAWLIDSAGASWRTPATTTHGDVAALGQFYVEEGGWLDLARRRARGGSDPRLDKGISAVLDAVDRQRLELDRRFAKALASWYAADRPSNGGAIAIDRALERLACRYLDEDPDRRLLVLLFDGMAWAQAVEIVLSMSRRQWEPLAWHSGKGRLVDGQSLPVVLASLPTVTEVSRSAFFAGKPMPAGKAPPTSDDPKWFAKHSKAQKLVPTTDVPKLFLKVDGHDPDGSASQPALTKIADTQHRIVAMVLNAIDASLKGDPQDHRRWDVKAIKSLERLLDEAQAAGRTVLIASDHGHVPSDLLTRGTTASRSKAKARWREYNEGEPVADYEVVLKAEEARDVFVPKGADGVALIADDQHRFGGSAGSGEHGGATLAEVVAPCLLLGSVGYEDTIPLLPPRWWTFDVGGAHRVRRSAPPVKKGRRKPKVSENQTSLPLPVEPTDAPLASTSAFASSSMLAARSSKRLRGKVVSAVEYLADRDGRASLDAFAGAMKMSVGRIEGLISKVGDALNVDGYAVLTLDRASRQVRLDIELLQQQFEVKL